MTRVGECGHRIWCSGGGSIISDTLDEYCVPFLLEEEEEEEEEESESVGPIRRHDDDHDAFVAKVAQEYADMMSDFTMRG